MKFSVIIPNLNSPTINKTIEAILDQQYDMQQVEIIVVGVDKHQQIKTKPNVYFDNSIYPISPAVARNRGAAQAQGSIFVFIDADCIPQKNWLDVLSNRFKSPTTNIVGGGVAFNTQNYWALADNLSMFYEYLSIHTPGERLQLPSLNLAIRAHIFSEVGGFDERYPKPAGEDADLTIRLRNRGHRLFFEPHAVVLHAPPRHRFNDMLRHSYYQGMYSTKVDPRYGKEEGLPGLLRKPIGLTLSAPFLAWAVTAGIFIKFPRLFRFWYTFPALYLSKIAWCWGAAHYHLP